MTYDLTGFIGSYILAHFKFNWLITLTMAAVCWNNVSQQASSHISINILNIDILIQYLWWLIY
jgi:hypothetical protein